MKSRTIYIYQDKQFESIYGAPCVIVNRKIGVSKLYTEIKFLFSKDETHYCFLSDLKKATPAMATALKRADEIYTKSKELGKVIQDIEDV